MLVVFPKFALLWPRGQPLEQRLGLRFGVVLAACGYKRNDDGVFVDFIGSIYDARCDERLEAIEKCRCGLSDSTKVIMECLSQNPRLRTGIFRFYM